MTLNYKKLKIYAKAQLNKKQTMRTKLLTLILGLFTILSSCETMVEEESKLSFFKEEAEAEWNGEGKPEWLQLRLVQIHMKEQTLTSSYAGLFLYKVYKFKSKEKPCISIQYVSFARIQNEEKNTRGEIYYSNVGLRIDKDKAKGDFDKTRQVILTNHLGGNDGKLPPIEFKSDTQDLQWLKEKIIERYNEAEMSGEITTLMNAISFKYQSELYYGIKRVVINKDFKNIESYKYYTTTGILLEDNSLLVNEFNTNTQITNNSISLWEIHVKSFMQQ